MLQSSILIIVDDIIHKLWLNGHQVRTEISWDNYKIWKDQKNIEWTLFSLLKFPNCMCIFILSNREIINDILEYTLRLVSNSSNKYHELY